MSESLTYSEQIQRAAEHVGLTLSPLSPQSLPEISGQRAADGGWIDEVDWQGTRLRQWRAVRGNVACLQAAWAFMPQLGFDGADALLLAGAFATQAATDPHKPLAWPVQAACFPVPLVSWIPGRQCALPRDRFAPCQLAPLGFYPVVDSLTLLASLLALGVRTLQFRIKAPMSAVVAAQIAEAIALGRRYQAQLFINDHWEVALAQGAYGVHLGQEDLAQADLAALAAAGLRLGVSTHGYAELRQALMLRPSYIALGHIFPTPTKQMSSRPQGLARLRLFQALVDEIPTVAIGGIDMARTPQVLACGVGSIAVVRAVTQAADLAATVQRWQALWPTLEQTEPQVVVSGEPEVRC